jgi:hypothetical protein
MATKGLETLYNWAKSTGYERSIDDFYNLISTNKDAFNRVYNYAKETGYERDENAFASLVGIQMSPPVKPIGPSKEGDAPTPSNEGGGAEEQPMPVDPVDPKKEGASPTPIEINSFGAGSEPSVPDAKTAAIESDLNSKLLPVTENTVIKEVPAETDKMVIKSPEKKKNFLEAADEVLYRIYNSPGYLKRLENEIAQSKDFNKDYDPKVLENLEEKTKDVMGQIRRLKPGTKEEDILIQELMKLGEQKADIYYNLSLVGGQYNTDELVNERKKRVETTPVELFEEVRNQGDAGYMRRGFTNTPPWRNEYSGEAGETLEEFEKREKKQIEAEKEFTLKNQPMETSIGLNTEEHKASVLKSNEYPSEDYRSDIMATTIEEKEHAAHVPLERKGSPGRRYSENITPYAVDLIDKNTVIDDEYLRKPTEVIAKKRATEVNLIGRGLLNPGEDVNESHFRELLNNPDLPMNVTQLLMSVSGVGYDEEDDKVTATTKKVQKAILNDPKLYKEALERWLNLMNKIAFNERQEPKSFNPNPFEIGKTKTG